MGATKAERLEIRLIALDNIRIDYELQSRAAMHKEYEREFMQAMLRGESFPPVHVFWDGNAYWLADGFHRCGAAKAAHIIDIRCQVHYGTRRDAIIFSAGCNKEFSIRRSEEDKRKAASMLFADEEWFAKSADLIAKHIGVTGGTINTWRVKWCQERGRKPPKKVLTARGTLQTSTPHQPGDVWQTAPGVYWVRHGGKDIRLEPKWFHVLKIRSLRHARRCAREFIKEAERQKGRLVSPWSNEDLMDAERLTEWLVKRGVDAHYRNESGFFCEHILIGGGDCDPRDSVEPIRAIVVTLGYDGDCLADRRHIPDMVGQLATLGYTIVRDYKDGWEFRPLPDRCMLPAPALIIVCDRPPSLFGYMEDDPDFPVRIHFASHAEIVERFGTSEELDDEADDE